VKVGRTTVAVLLAAAMLLPGAAAPGARADAPTPVEGEWGGRTTDTLKVSFEVHGGVVEDARFTFAWGFCGLFESNVPHSAPIRPDGSWVYLDGRGPEIEASFTAPDEVTGTVIAPSRELPGCPRTEATFVAHPGPVPPAPPILIPTGRGSLVAEPRRISLEARPGASSFFDLDWSRIGPFEAHARGRALVHLHGRTIRREPP
jgi:hypothetical protein